MSESTPASGTAQVADEETRRLCLDVLRSIAPDMLTVATNVLVNLHDETIPPARADRLVVESQAELKV